MTPLRRSRVVVVLTIVGDVAVLLSLAAVFVATETFGVPFHTGFYCGDNSIGYPYRDNTISVGMLLILTIFIPLVLILVWETLEYLYTNRGESCSCLMLTVRLLKGTTVFVSGFGIVSCIVSIVKYSLGRLRPHFIAVCQPDWAAINCSDGYVQDYTCTGPDTATIREARLSFPSGHAVTAFYGLTYLAVFLNQRLPSKGMIVLKPFLVAVVLTAAAAISITRLMDHFHRPHEVLFGSIFGASVAVLMTKYTATLRPSTQYSIIGDNDDSDKDTEMAESVN